MGLITVHYENFESVSKTAVDADLLSDYIGVFDDDQGSLPWAAHFIVDETVTPVISPASRILHDMKLTVKTELEKLTVKKKKKKNNDKDHSPWGRTDKLV